MRTLEITLIICETNLILMWSTNCFISTDINEAKAFAITNTKVYIPAVPLATQNNAKKPLQQLKSVFYRTINKNKFESKIAM